MSWRRDDSDDARLIRRTMLRIGLQSALVVGATVVLLCAVAVLVVLHSQHDEQNATLATAIARADDVSDPPAGTWLVVLAQGQIQATSGLPPGLPDVAAIQRVRADGIATTEDFRVDHEREYRVRTERAGDKVIQAILDLRPAHIERSRLVQALLISGVAGLLLAVLTGAWVARRAVLPLVGALALQRRFVADASHELRTPLTLLSTRAQMLRRRLRGQPTEADVNGLVEDAGELGAILEDLLLAADPRENVPRQPVELGALVRQAVDAATPAATEHGIELVVLDGPAPVWVSGYEAALRRAVNALLDNGVRHAHSRLRVALGVSGRQVRVDVADDGPGIDAAVLPNLFTRFVKASADAAPGERRRYGLGLSLVSEIAARHGGSVAARNPDSGGATLSLSLPLLRNGQVPGVAQADNR
ncbi:HAMP domain-containing histidine kinase [Amycolatopsis rhizosphaerae]|uniref:histidine kinase n=1 Tax=Amycolatopsis rhizosphaerae TaxID=2053003 RepID=A0A558DCS8_9PSEU|nr:HAMP domain-containing sensor histidine kinase [Amycolatopsis rhizosphaerae]TVT58806.1 HAMP domain-containing histidine kinase [Amycolatopsis rhizosphaerae]